MTIDERIRVLIARVGRQEKHIDEYKLIRNLTAEVADGFLRSTQVTQKQAIALRNGYGALLDKAEKDLIGLRWELDYLQRMEGEVA